MKLFKTAFALTIGLFLTAARPAIVKEEFVFTKAPFASCHASTLTETSPGHILCAYFAGTAEGNPDVAIWLSSLEENSWSDPKKVAEVEKTPCWNPVLFTMPSGEVLLFYKGGPSPQTWSGFLKRSTTQGNEWSNPELLPAGVLGPVRSKPLLLDDGTLLCGSSIESYKRWGSWVEITRDHGRTWTKSNPINLKTNVFGVIQPSFFKGKDNELKMALRSRDTGRVCLASSGDGLTWSDAEPTELPNPNAAVEALTLADGRALLVFNNSTNEPDNVWGLRNTLFVDLSNDGGTSWHRVVELENDLKNPDREFSYPAAIQTSDGLVHITYTYDRVKIKHVVLDPRSFE